MSAVTRATLLGLGIVMANIVGITVAVLNGVEVFVAISAAALVAIGLTVVLAVATLITGRYPLWGQPKAQARLSALSSLAMSFASAITVGTLLVPGPRPRPLLGVLIIAVAMPLMGISAVLSFRAARLSIAEQS